MVEKINHNEIRVMKALLKLNLGTTRKELHKILEPEFPFHTFEGLRRVIRESVTSLSGFIHIRKLLKGRGRPSEVISLTPAGRMVIKAFIIANG